MIEALTQLTQYPYMVLYVACIAPVGAVLILLTGKGE